MSAFPHSQIGSHGFLAAGVTANGVRHSGEAVKQQPHLHSRRPGDSGEDSYALCRVFKKHVAFGEFEKHGECSLSQAKENQEQVTNFGDAGQSSGANENDKDNSWMQFMTDDLWCTNKTK